MLDQTLRMHDLVEALNSGDWQRGNIHGSRSHGVLGGTTVIDSYDVMLAGLTRLNVESDDQVRLISRANKNA
jgi:hypothetical protein